MVYLDVYTAIKAIALTNEIMSHLYVMYGVEQSTTMPYNPHGNAPTERLNRMLIGLLKSLPKEQKSNWPLHLPSLVFAYNATPHDTTGYQPYEFMFGHKAPTMCDSWLGLANYNDNCLQSKCMLPCSCIYCYNYMHILLYSCI